MAPAPVAEDSRVFLDKVGDGAVGLLTRWRRAAARVTFGGAPASAWGWRAPLQMFWGAVLWSTTVRR